MAVDLTDFGTFGSTTFTTGSGPVSGLGGPIGAGVGQAAAGALSGLLGGQAPPAVSNNASRINVAPVAVNFGEILRPFNAGSLTNGGFGLDVADRFVDSLRPRGILGGPLRVEGAGALSIDPTLILVVGGGLVLLAALARRR